jgi:hypothetical protein
MSAADPGAERAINWVVNGSRMNIWRRLVLLHFWKVSSFSLVELHGATVISRQSPDQLSTSDLHD